MNKLHWRDLDDLAIAALELPEDADSDAIENALLEKLDVSPEQFEAVIEAVIGFTAPARAAISGEAFKGFVNDGAFIIKVPANAMYPADSAG